MSTDLYEALVAIENEGIHVVFPEPLEPHAERLLKTLGVTWSVDPNAPRLAEPTFDPNDRGDRKVAHLRQRCPWRDAA